MAWSQEKINEIYVEGQKMAVTDEEFRKELLEDPTSVIERVAGEKLPEGFQVNVIENDPAYAATFVLPPMVSDELDESELDMVAGGNCLVNMGCGAEACAADATLK